MSTAEPPQGANSAPAGGSAAREPDGPPRGRTPECEARRSSDRPQAWGDHASQLVLAPEIVDEKLRRNAMGRMRELNVALPTFSQLADPDLIPARQLAALAGVDPDEPHAANLWRVHWFNDEPAPAASTSRAYRVAQALTGVKATIVVAARRALSHDRRAQGARRLWLPGAASRDRPLRPEACTRRSGHRRQLLPRRRRDLAHSRLPRRGRIARGHEPRALRMARAMGGGSRGHRPHAGNGKQRQGNLRQVRGALPRPAECDSQSVFRVQQLPHPLSLHRRARSIACSTHAPNGARAVVSRPSFRRRARQGRSPPATTSSRFTARG